MDWISNERAEKPMNTREKYLSDVRALVHSAAKFLAEDEISEIYDLVSHGEPAEGLANLAWIIVQHKIVVPSSIILEICSLTEGLLEEDALPPNFASFGLA